MWNSVNNFYIPSRFLQRFPSKLPKANGLLAALFMLLNYLKLELDKGNPMDYISIC